MEYKEKFELTSQIICAIINNPNIEVHLSKNFEEVGIKDKKSGAYMLISELVEYFTKYM